MDNWEKVGEIRLEGKDVYLLKEQYILEPNKEERYYRLYFYIVCQELMDVLSRYLVKVSGKYTQGDAFFSPSHLVSNF